MAEEAEGAGDNRPVQRAGAALGTLFFAHVADALGPAGSGPWGAFTDAFAAVLPWQVGLYVGTRPDNVGEALRQYRSYARYLDEE